MAVGSGLCLTSQGLAADSAWNVNAAGNWGTAGNWTGSVIPGATSGSTSTDIATFGFVLTAARTVTVDTDRNIGGITFGNPSGFGYTLSGGSLLLSSGGVIQNLAGTGDHTNTITSPVIIQGNNGTATFTANATSGTSLLVIGTSTATPVSGVSTTGNLTTLTLNGTNTAIGNSVGILSDGTAGGKLALVKNDSGTWTIGLLSNSSTFTGGITINAGTLRGASTLSGQAFGAGNAITLANTAGAILDMSGASVSQSIGSLAGGGSLGGNVTMGANTLILGLDDSSTSYAGTVSGTGGITKVGIGTQTFSGPNTYTGVTRLNGGTLALDFSAATAPATNMIGSTSILNLANGTLRLIGKADTTNSQTFASTSLIAGSASAIRLTADTATNPLMVNIGAITRGAGSTLDITLPTGSQSATNGIRTTTTNMRNNVLTNSSEVAYATVGGTTWASVSGGNLVSFTGTYSTGPGNYTTNNNIDVTDGDSVSDVTVNTLRFNGNDTLTLSGTNTVATGGILITSATTAGAGITGGTLRSSGTADALTFINNGTRFTVDSVIANNPADPTSLTLAGPGTTILNGENTYTGVTYITGGTLQLGNTAALGTAGIVTFADNPGSILDVNDLDISLASLAGGGNQGSAAGMITIGTAGGTVAVGTRTLTLGTTGTTTSTFGGNITGTTGSIVKVGTNFQRLMGTNTLTGGVTIKAGTLSASGVVGNNALGSGTVTLGDSDGGNADATLRVGNTLGVVGIYIYPNPIVLAPNTTGMLQVNSNSSSGSMNLTGGVTGPNNFSINSSGTGGSTLIFSTNPINNTGNLTIGGSTGNTNISITGGIGPNVTNVTLVRNNAFGSSNNGITISTTAVNNNGTISNIGTQTQSNTISAVIGTNVTGIIQDSATASLTLSGANLFTAPIAVSAGTLTLSTSNSAAGVNSAVSLANVAGAQIISTTTAPNFGSLAGGGTTGGNVNLNSTLASTLTVGGDNTATTYSGVIGGTAPSVGLTKVGTGTLTLSGSSAYTGTTTLTAGTLIAANTQALGTSAAPLLLNGGTLNLATDASITAYNTTVGGNTTIQSNKATAASAGITHAMGTLSIGAFTLNASAGANATSGTPAISFGNTALTGAPIFNTTTANLTLGSLSATAARIIVKQGAGTLVLNGAGSGFLTASGVTVNGGTVRQDVSNALTSTSLFNLIVNGTAAGTTAAYNLNDVNQSILALTFGVAASATANTLNNVATGTGTLTLGGNVTYAKATLDANDPGTSTLSGNLDLGGATRTFTVADSTLTTNELNVSAVIGVTGAFGISKAGTGTMTLANANTYTGTTTMSSGVLRLNNATAIPGGIGSTGGTSALTLSGGVLGLGQGDFTRPLGTGSTQVQLTATTGFAAFGADRNVNLGGASAGVTYGAGSFMTAGTLILGHTTATHTLNFQNPIDLNLASRSVQVDNGAASVDAILSGAITGGAFSLTKSGAGTLRLDNTGNAYTGGTVIDSGTLRLGAAGVIPDTGTVTIRRSATAGSTDGVLDLNGFSETIAGLNLGSTSTVAAQAGQTVSVINSGNPAAVLTLGGTLTYLPGSPGNLIGKATISANLDLGGANRSITVGDGAAVDDLEISGAITGANSIIISGLGTLLLSNPNNAHVSTTLLGTTTLKLGADSVLGTGNLNLGQLLAGTSTLDLNGKTDTIAGATLFLSSVSTTALGAANQIIDSSVGGVGLLRLGGSTVTYNSGATNFHNGTTTISANLDLDSASTARTFAINDSNQTTQEVIISGVISNSQGTGGLTKTLAGSLILSGANTYTGPTNVNGGTLILNGNQAAATGNVTVATAATLGGGGSLGGDTVVNGILSTGSSASVGSVGDLTFSGATTDLTFATGSAWLIDIVQGAEDNADTVVVGGLLALGSSLLNPTFSFTGTYTLSTKYTLATYGSLSGAFSSYTDNAVYTLGGSGGGAYLFRYNDNGAITLTAVPEPGTLGMLGMGILGFAVRMYRRKKATSA